MNKLQVQHYIALITNAFLKTFGWRIFHVYYEKLPAILNQFPLSTTISIIVSIEKHDYLLIILSCIINILMAPLEFQPRLKKDVGVFKWPVCVPNT